MVETTYQMLEVLLLHVRLGDGLTSFIENNSANFSGEISASKLSGMSIQFFLAFLSIREKGKSQISYSLSFSITNLKVQIEAPLLKVSKGILIARPTHLFRKVKKNNPDSLVKEASTLIYKHTILFY